MLRRSKRHQQDEESSVVQSKNGKKNVQNKAKVAVEIQTQPRSSDILRRAYSRIATVRTVETPPLTSRRVTVSQSSSSDHVPKKQKISTTKSISSGVTTSSETAPSTANETVAESSISVATTSTAATSTAATPAVPKKKNTKPKTSSKIPGTSLSTTVSQSSTSDSSSVVTSDPVQGGGSFLRVTVKQSTPVQNEAKFTILTQPVSPSGVKVYLFCNSKKNGYRRMLLQPDSEFVLNNKLKESIVVDGGKASQSLVFKGCDLILPDDYCQTYCLSSDYMLRKSTTISNNNSRSNSNRGSSSNSSSSSGTAGVDEVFIPDNRNQNRPSVKDFSTFAKAPTVYCLGEVLGIPVCDVDQRLRWF